MVHSHLDYANSIVQASTNIKRLQTEQNSLARVVLKSHPHLSPSSFLHKLHRLPLHSHITCKLVGHAYKNTGQPSYLCSLFHHYKPAQTLHFVRQYLLEQLCVCTDFGNRAFAYIMPKVWNNLPLEIKSSTSYQTFKLILKPTYSVHPITLNSILTQLSTPSASDSALLTLCAL